MRFEEKLGSLPFGISFFRVKGERGEKTVLNEKSTYLFRQSFYMRKVGNQIFIDSILDLSIAKFLVTMCLKQFYNFFLIMNRKHKKNRFKEYELFSFFVG